MDAAAMSFGSASGRSMRNVLGPSGMISGNTPLGSGMGNVQGQINMMQLMGMNPPPFGRRLADQIFLRLDVVIPRAFHSVV